MEKTKGKEHMKIIGLYARGHRYLILAGRALAGVSALLTLVPYYLLWKIIKIAAEGTGLDSIKTFAWQAVALTVIALLVYIAALLCTHIAAFRVQANMRISLMKRILTLPLGVFDDEGSGRIRHTLSIYYPFGLLYSIHFFVLHASRNFPENIILAFQHSICALHRNMLDYIRSSRILSTNNCTAGGKT